MQFCVGFTNNRAIYVSSVRFFTSHGTAPSVFGCWLAVYQGAVRVNTAGEGVTCSLDTQQKDQ